MNIVIVGGGTAGWLAALMISKIQKNSHNITVIESSKIGIIGAGEGSTGLLTDIIQGFNWDYGCNEQEFLKETGSTIKLGIEHKDWATTGKSYFAPLGGSYTESNTPDQTLIYALAKDLPPHRCNDQGLFFDENKCDYWIENGKLKNTQRHAYHFDGHKVGKYFKKVVMKENITYIDAEVLDVTVNDTGISSIKLSSGQEVFGDFFIDCSGFARKLTASLNVKWHSYSKNLTVNSAMPFLLPYEEQEQIKPATTAWAQSSGWMWKIPTSERYGCGYVYDSNFISDEQAHAEIETVLGRKVDPIKFIKFDTGRLENTWTKNCLALGLAAAFAEPLEATSIHATICQLTRFIFDYLRDTKEETCNFGFINIYNSKINLMYDEFKEFLVLHYQTKRNDSEFWRYVSSGATRTNFVNEILELSKYRLTTNNYYNTFYGYAGAGLWNWILAGLGHINKDTALKEAAFYNLNLDKIKTTLDVRQKEGLARRKTMLTHNEFIQYVHAH